MSQFQSDLTDYIQALRLPQTPARHALWLLFYILAALLCPAASSSAALLNEPGTESCPLPVRHPYLCRPQLQLNAIARRLLYRG